ncbi:MAG: c-type cytochrome [Flavobacteriales bacterium]|nr:c-type cytochrome [Flavobacteriales bacterium]MCB9194344.1 c-type cytochrome [Flavobacteriales bacterium]
MRSYHIRTAILVLVAVSIIGISGCRKEDPEPPADTGFHATPYDLQIPSNLPPMTIPADNPITQEGVELGRYLFYDERLSGDNTQACATCHAPAYAFTDHGNQFSEGIDHLQGTRNAMPLFNLGWGQYFFWDGRAATLEDQILQPVTNPIEMHDTWPNAASKIDADPAYGDLFYAAFGDSRVDSLQIAKAIAQFLRTMISANSPFDKWKRGEGTISVDAQQGYALFQLEGGQPPFIPNGQGGADCFHCHTPAGDLFTDEQFHNNALDSVFTDLGRGGVTGDPFDMGKFKTPSLRNIMLTAPYMHDGRFATIDEVLDHYNDGGVTSATVDPFMKFTDPDQTLELNAQDRQQIIAFLNSLTDHEFITDPRFQDPGQP